MTELIVAIEPNGFGVAVREVTNGRVHRRVVLPGRFDDAGEWIAADLSGEPDAVKDAAAKAWVPEVVAAYRARWAPAPKTEPPVKPEPDPRTVLLDKMIDEYAAKVAGDAAAPVDLKAAAVARIKDRVTP